MSLIALQQIVQRLGRPQEIQSRLAVLKIFNSAESKKALKMCEPIFSHLPIDVGTHIFSRFDPLHTTKFAHQWMEGIFKGFNDLSSAKDITQCIVKVGRVVQSTQVELPNKLHQSAAKALKSFHVGKELASELYEILPTVVEKSLAMNVEKLYTFSSKINPPMYMVNHLVGNIVSLYEFATPESKKHIDHLLNWTGISSLHSEDLDQLRSLVQHQKLSQLVDTSISCINKRKM